MKHWPLVGCIALIVGALGLFAAGKFHESLRHGEDKSVCSYQLIAAADQYFLETEAELVRFDDLVGPDKYVRKVTPVAGEDYRAAFPLRRGFRELAVTMADGRRVIIFDRAMIRQDPDGSFAPARNNPGLVAEYQRWLAAGKPPH